MNQKKSALNIRENRRVVKYSYREQILRILWSFGQIFFRITPRPFFTIRNQWLRLFGAKVGKNVRIYSNTTIFKPWNLSIGDWSAIGEDAYIYNLGKVKIGEKATVSQRAHLCAGSHDYLNPALPLLKPEIRIGNQVWVCADAFVGPGVMVNDGAVVGARAVVTKDIEAWTVVAGNPAKTIKKREMV